MNFQTQLQKDLFESVFKSTTYCDVCAKKNNLIVSRCVHSVCSTDVFRIAIVASQPARLSLSACARIFIEIK